MVAEAGDVRITQREVYNLVLEVRDTVLLLANRDKESDAIHADFESRIRSLEMWRWKAAGAILLVSFFFSVFGYFIAQAVIHR